MTPDTSRRPFHVLRLGIWLLLSGVLLALALLLWGNLQEIPPNLIRPGIAVAVALLAAGLGVMWYSRRLRQSQRPEWLETKAWKRDLMDKLQRGGPPPSGPGGTPPE